MFCSIEALSKEDEYSAGIKKICDFLIKIGVYPKLKGYNLIISSVICALRDPDCLHSITTILYPTIAKSYNVSVACVERNVRNAIDTAYNSGKLHEIANTFYGGNFKKYERPTNGEFISYLANIVKFSSW